MVKEQVRNEGGGANSWARVCDTCRAAACTVYCKADAAYLCSACDSRVHAANMVASRHERVWICQACERAPAAFICKADAASLCAACDAEVHSANPLARRHHRVPIMPLYDCNIPVDENDDVNDDDEAASWLLLNPPVVKNGNNQHSNNGYASVDEYLDVVEYNKNSSCFENQFNDQYGSQSVIPDEQRKFGDDSVVPALQFGVVRNRFQQQQQHEYEQEQLDAFHLGLDYDNSKAGYTYNSSLAPSVSHSSIDVSVVPDTGDVSIGHSRAPKGTIDLFSGPPLQMTPQLTPVNREARVLRYREKKKTRKFEKTIRYASRKAYAETRPRIKGRFAKRTDVEVEVDQMFSTTLSSDTGYGIVPSF